MTSRDADSGLAAFQRERPRLRALAYRMTGTPDDADDVVQDVWLRWQTADRSSIVNPAAWLTTVTTRVALDRLTSAAARRERYVGPWLPEPFADLAELGELGDLGTGDPADTVAQTETITLGFMRVLETLQPVERAVFLLHDVLGMPFADVASAVSRSDAATRQIAKRARDRIRDGRPRLTPPPADVEQLSQAFLAAVLDGDVDRLSAMLTDDVVSISDGGPQRHAARRPIVGRDKVARLFVNLGRREFRETDELHPVVVNGQPGAYFLRDGEPYLLTVFGWRGTQVAETIAILNPDKLAHFHTRWRATTNG